MLENDASFRQLTELLNSFSCTHLITKPTQITGETATLLDVCISNVHSPDITSGLLSVDISEVENSQHTMTRRTDEHGLNQYWGCVLSERNVTTAYNTFFEKLFSCYELAFPLKRGKTGLSNIRKPWIIEDMLRRIRKKNKMYPSFVKTRDPYKLIYFKKIRNQMNAEIKMGK